MDASPFPDLGKGGSSFIFNDYAQLFYFTVQRITVDAK